MTDLVPVRGEILETGPGALPVPVLIAEHGEDAWRRFIEFFTAQIRNQTPHWPAKAPTNYGPTQNKSPGCPGLFFL